MQNRVMQKATVVCITQGRGWAGRALFPRILTAEEAWLLGIAQPDVKPARRMRVVYRRDTNFVGRKANFAIGFTNDGVV
jgi:hypothetical protein